jgi:hypothetical protein
MGTRPGNGFRCPAGSSASLRDVGQRIQDLAELVTRYTSDDSGEPRPDHDGTSHLYESVLAIDARVGSVPFVRLQLQLAPVVTTCRRLMEQAADVPDELMQLTARSYGLAARLAFETGDDETAHTLYTDAAGVAGRLKDLSYRAAIRVSHTMVTLHAANDPDVGMSLARVATVDAHQGTSCAVRARAHAVHAEACARAGHAREASEALERARKTVAQLTDDDRNNGFNGDRLAGFEGLCALHSGDIRRAHDHLDRSLVTLGTSSRNTVQRGIVSADLAVARLRLGDPAACVELMHEAVDITAASGGRVAAQRIRQVRRELRPWRTEDFLVELDDHIHDTLIGR